MDPDTEITLSALKFLCGENENVCRLCFSSTEEQKVSIEDNVRLQKDYIDDTITFLDMFHELGVTTEPLLPQVLCMVCAKSTIKSYLFQKRCQYSNKKWDEVIDRAMNCLSLADTLGPTDALVTLMINKEDNTIYTSRKALLASSKENALCKLKYMMRRKFRYEKDKEKTLKVKCKVCGDKFRSNNLLHKHMKLHRGPKGLELRCPRCNRVYNNRPSYKYHVLRCGKFTKKQPRFFCENCSKGYVNKKGLQVHLKISHGFGEVVSCEYCGKKFDYKSKLQKHIVTHSSIKDFSCQVCGAEFSFQSSLIAHTRLHTGEKPFQCNFCHESFHSKARRMEHMYKEHIPVSVSKKDPGFSDNEIIYIN